MLPAQGPVSPVRGLSAIVPSPGLSRALLVIDRVLALVPKIIRTHLGQLFFVNWSARPGGYIGNQFFGMLLLTTSFYLPLLAMQATGYMNMAFASSIVFAMIPTIWIVAVAWCSWFSALDEDVAIALAESSGNLSCEDRGHLARIFDERGSIRFMDVYRVGRILSAMAAAPRQEPVGKRRLIERLGETPLGPFMSARSLDRSVDSAPSVRPGARL